LATLVVGTLAVAAAPDEEEWVELAGTNGLGAWKSPTGTWAVVGEVKPKTDNPKLLGAEDGMGVIYNGPLGRTRNLISKASYGDVELHVEFLIPKGSNSGIKLQGLYEIQIFDSWNVAKPKAGDCGGIYPRAELGPPYHYLDKGHPPRVNACRPPGEWQTLDIVFRAPRFDADGKKVGNARFDNVTLNGEVIHENLEVATPTGHAWHEKEVAVGPLLLQADHGPVAFRSVKVRGLRSDVSSGQRP
jgi:hypothetical protein